jgi:hypothetical protein
MINIMSLLNAPATWVTPGFMPYLSVVRMLKKNKGPNNIPYARPDSAPLSNGSTKEMDRNMCVYFCLEITGIATFAAQR